MRIRADFVTNSSSTDFILRSVTSGMLPPIPSYEKLARFLSEYHFVSASEGKWAKFTRAIPSKRYDGANGVIEVKISKGCEWRNKKRIHESVDFLLLEICSPVVSTKHQARICLNKSTSILQKIVACRPIDFAVLFYFQHVHELIGDGWDGGDPGGVYGWTHEVLRDQSRFGDIFIVDNKVSMKLAESESNSSLIEGVEELMDSPGHFLPLKPIRPSPHGERKKWRKSR